MKYFSTLTFEIAKQKHRGLLCATLAFLISATSLFAQVKADDIREIAKKYGKVIERNLSEDGF